MSMRYKLPDSLGGGEVDVLHGFAREDNLVDCKLSDKRMLSLPLSWLTEVKPLLPAEPPPGSVVLVDGAVYHHRPSGVGRWFNTVRGGWTAWKHVCSFGTPVLLVPAPEPIELPWRTDFGIPAVGVGTDSEGYPTVRIWPANPEFSVTMSKGEARAMAAALITAAGGA